MKRTRPLRQKIAILNIGVAFVAIGFILGIWLPNQERAIQENFVAKTHKELDLLATLLVSPLIQNQFAVVHENLDYLRQRRPNWLSVAVVNPEGRRLYPLDPPPPVEVDGTDVVALSHPIELRGQTLATIRMVVDVESEIHLLHRQTNHLVATLVIVFLVSIVVGWGLLDAFVSRPVARLADAAKQLAAGRIVAPLPNAGTSEIDDLNSSFLEMAANIREHRQELEREVDERTAELRSAKELAEQANRAKSDFLSSMSHDLRTPLNAIIGFSQLLLVDRKNELTPQQKGWIDSIQNGGNHLLSLVDQILDLAAIEADKVVVSPEPLKIGELIDELNPVATGLAEKANIDIRFSVDPDDTILADRIRVRQVMFNLISNAIKYNYPGGNVSVSSEAANDTIRLLVRDTGKGIAPEMHGEIFKPFNRGDAFRAGADGTGIGLTITKKLTELMNGEIGFESSPDEGSTFWVSFPRANCVAASQPARGVRSV